MNIYPQTWHVDSYKIEILVTKIISYQPKLFQSTIPKNIFSLPVPMHNERRTFFHYLISLLGLKEADRQDQNEGSVHSSGQLSSDGCSREKRLPYSGSVQMGRIIHC